MDRIRFSGFLKPLMFVAIAVWLFGVRCGSLGCGVAHRVRCGSLGCGVAHRVRCGSAGCGVAQIVAHRLAVRQARVVYINLPPPEMGNAT
jgi:hypothetical protein